MITWQLLMILTTLGGLTLAPALPVSAYEPIVCPWQVAQASGFSSASGRFAVAFPENPSISSEMDDINGDLIELYEFSVETDDYSYAVLYADMPSAFLRLGTETVLNKLRDALLEDLDLEDLTELEVDVQLSGYPGRRYSYSDRNGTLDIRLYLVDERMYWVIASDTDETSVNRFVNSFALL
ncbi:MAG: hypothetical protein QNJ41_19975 [Xenococcaceae cyanobacterium MO_188.B32]|nr:hypothetical protein [Xenococcaceae cyanobacterium MO_188.B32]